MENIVRINPTGHIPDRNRGFPDNRKKKKQKRKPRQNVKERLEDLRRTAKEADQAFDRAGSPFRIRLYDENGDIYINVVTLDRNGRVNQIFQKDITHGELEQLVRHINSGRGIVLNERC